MKNGKCPAGEYYCYTNKECKPIPKGFMVDPEGMLRKENGASTTKEEWSQKYKKSIDCDNPKGFSQKAHCHGRKKKMKSIKEEGLRDWFGKSKSKDGKKGWVNVVTGDSCASDKPGEGIPKCVSSAKRASMSKKERLAAAAAKRREDPGQQKKTGASKPTNVKTDRKTRKESVELVDAYGETFATIQDIIKPEPMKETVCPRCGQNPCVCSETYDIESMTEAKDRKGKGSGTKDACYHKVKSRYSVWPSAYASGALVKCRKVGAANWGNKTKKEEFEFSPSQVMALEAAGLIQLNEKGQKCWKGYEKKGTKKMFGKTYNNCVKKEEFVAEEESDRRKDERQERGGVDGNTDYKRPAKNNTKKFGTGKTAMQKEMEKKHGKGKSAMDIVMAEIRAKHKKKEDKKENTNEERIRINQNGHTYAVMLNWRGKTYTVQIFFPELRKPTRQEVEDKIRKIYPDAKVTYFAPKEFDPADPTVMVGENVEVIDERKMTDGEMQKEKKLRKKYDKGDMKKSMKDQYGEEEGKKIYFAKIRKLAMEGKYSSSVRATYGGKTETFPVEVYKKKSKQTKVAEGKGDPCWDTHKQVGMKKKGGKMVPNCVPKEETQIGENRFFDGARGGKYDPNRTQRQIEKDIEKYGNTVPRGSFGISLQGRIQATNQRTNKPPKKDTGSFFDGARGGKYDQSPKPTPRPISKNPINVEYDRLRYSKNPEERAQAAGYGMSKSKSNAPKTPNPLMQIYKKTPERTAELAAIRSKAKQETMSTSPSPTSTPRVRGGSARSKMFEMTSEKKINKKLQKPVDIKKLNPKDYIKNSNMMPGHGMEKKIAEDWQKKSGKNPEGGLNEKGRKSYERENPGSDLKAPTKKKGNPRRASFCARMKGMKKKLTSKKTANDPDSRINKSLRKWDC